MKQSPKYYIVDADALPAVFLKVAEAKRMLEIGEVATVHEATKAVDISRSAFYTVSRLHCTLSKPDWPAESLHFKSIFWILRAISTSVLGVFAGCGANILTINRDHSLRRFRHGDDFRRDRPISTVRWKSLLRQLNASTGVIHGEILAG